MPISRTEREPQRTQEEKIESMMEAVRNKENLIKGMGYELVLNTKDASKLFVKEVNNPSRSYVAVIVLRPDNELVFHNIPLDSPEEAGASQENSN